MIFNYLGKYSRSISSDGQGVTNSDRGMRRVAG